MKFLSLFSGIGGMDLGLERAGMTCIGQVEIDPFCRRVLAKHWPGVPKFDDVRTFDVGSTEQFDAVAGGFPCIDISRMGKRAGISGEFSGLWREMLRRVRVAGSAFAIVENVESIVERGLGTVLGDLAAIGRDSEWDCISAAGCGVPQSRSRAFVLAYPDWWQSQEPHERTILHSEIASDGVERYEPLAIGMRADFRDSDRVDVCRRISACANAVVPQVAEAIGRAMMECL